jgi:hypothetical protein
MDTVKALADFYVDSPTISSEAKKELKGVCGAEAFHLESKDPRYLNKEFARVYEGRILYIVRRDRDRSRNMRKRSATTQGGRQTKKPQVDPTAHERRVVPDMLSRRPRLVGGGVQRPVRESKQGPPMTYWYAALTSLTVAMSILPR